MKHKNLTRAAGLLAACLALGLAGCGATASSTATAETAPTATPETTASSAETAETADPYAYLANFDYSSLFDDNGYVAGLNIDDYVTVPADLSLTLSDEANTVSQTDIDEYIDSNVLAGFAEETQVTDRAAADGDTVNIDYTGTIDGGAFDGGSATGDSLTLGSGRFIDNFEEQIVGHMPGETFDVTVTFPEDYGNEELNGKEAVFETTLNYIAETSLPELTDDWVTSNLNTQLGITSVEGLRSYVEGILLFEQQANEIYTQLNDQLTISEDLPEEVTSYFEDLYLQQPYAYAQMSGMSLNDFLAASGIPDAETYLTYLTANIQGSARQMLIMQAMAEHYGIVCDDATLESEFSNQFGTTDSSSYIESYGANYLKMTTLNDLVMNHMIEQANA